MLIDKKKLFLMLMFFGCCSLYFTLSIPSNSISWDQQEAIGISKNILKGNFPLHGYKHSNGMYSFPAFYYIVSPLVYISDEPMFLYASVAILYVIGVLLLANYIYEKFGYFECGIFLFFSGTHVWSLLFASYFWNPNYIPFFMCLFILSLAKQINKKSPVIYFHVSGIILNIIVQMMPQTIILIPSFVFILYIFKILPSIFNQIIHVCFQLILVYPWIHFYMFILDWDNHKITGKLFKNLSAIFEYMNFLGGWGLTSEYIDYSFYGTNTYPFTEYFDVLLTFSSILMIIMISYSTYITFTKINYINIFNLKIKEMSGINIEKQKLFMALTILNFSCIFYFLSGMHMTPHHYQFLTPLLAFNLTLLASLNNLKKIITSILLLCILMQGSFSYWRAFSEYKKPYVTDIGYSDKFTNYFTNYCNSDSTAFILNPKGLYLIKSSKNFQGEKSCGRLILVLRDHYTESEIVRWFLKNYLKTDMKFKDYIIWSRKKIK